MATLTKLLDVSIAALMEAAADYDLKVYETGTAGRGNGIDVILVDDEGMTLAELRVYAKTVQILNPTKWGWPQGCTSSSGSYERWTPHHVNPADFRREMDALVTYYIYRREGQEA